MQQQSLFIILFIKRVLTRIVKRIKLSTGISCVSGKSDRLRSTSTRIFGCSCSMQISRTKILASLVVSIYFSKYP